MFVTPSLCELYFRSFSHMKLLIKNKKETGILFIPKKFTIPMEIVETEIHAGGVEGNIILYYNTKNKYLSNSLVNFIIIPDNNKIINE